MTGEVGTVRVHYLDASALVKLIVDEPNNSRLKEYFNKSHVFRMTSLCFAEALGVLKVKYLYRKEITEKGYLRRSYLLTVYLREGRIKLDEVPLTDATTFDDVEEIVKKHQIDVSDALQIVTLKKGRYRSFVGESQSLLITADADLAKAARSEGLQVWDCINEASPEHSPETAR
jgi:predicted nucleic acid-binding protein